MHTVPAPKHSQTPDEIDLLTLIENIWKQKTLISLITLLFLLVGIIVAYTTPPAYKASISLRPIDQGSLKPLSSLTLYSEIAEEPLLRELLFTLETTSFREQFISTSDITLYKELYADSNRESKIRSFADHYKFITTDTKHSLFPYRIEFTAPSGESATNELNRLIDTAAASLHKNLQSRYALAANNEIVQIGQKINLLEEELAAERNDEIIRLQESHDLEIQKLNDQLIAYKQAYKTNLSDRIHSLGEAYSIAAELDLKDPISLNQIANKTTGRIEVISANQSDPLYLRGTRLLGKELEQLKARPDNYFPDPKVRDLETKIALMKNNRQIEMLAARESDSPFSSEIQTLKARLLTIQKESFPEALSLNFSPAGAVAEEAPLKPKKTLIIALSLVLGLMVSLITVLVRTAILNRQETSSNYII